MEIFLFLSTQEAVKDTAAAEPYQLYTKTVFLIEGERTLRFKNSSFKMYGR